MANLQEMALEYHRREPRGKIEVRPTKPTRTQRDLTLAYTPGVAAPCLEIARDRELSYEYTAKSNLVAVITNGTAVLGLGNIGPDAAKPVMEGKGVLFKKFADIDVLDLEVNEPDPDRFIQIVKALEPSFGGINLEDIKGPECFHIEGELRRLMNIPVFHDDQHGTAIITGAAMLNALEFAQKNIEDIKLVVSGAGAAALGCVRLYLELGVRRENITLTDIHGVVYKGRKEEMDPHKGFFAVETKARTLAEVIVGADMFLGLSAPDVLTPEMMRSMARDPIVFALANPDPEIRYETAREARPDAILATGRSDYPNQVNNVLCFPYVFRGALDVQAREINVPMKLAAVHALSALVKEDTPDEVLIAYGLRSLHYSRDYLIPTAFDPRVLRSVSTAVAEAAIASGVARVTAFEADEYRDRLAARQSVFLETSRSIVRRARLVARRRVVYPEALNETILRATHQIAHMRLAQPILVGDEERIRQTAEEFQVSLTGVEIVDNRKSPLREAFAQRLFKERQRKGLEYTVATLLMDRPVEFSLMMVKSGEADCFVGGITRNYPAVIRPALQIIGIRDNVSAVAGLYMILYRGRTLFLADTTVNFEPTAEQLAEIAINTANAARIFGVQPRVALLSYSNFGSVRNPDLARITTALKIVRQREPGLMIDGEMQGNLAVNAELRSRLYPFTTLEGAANVLIFPNLHAANTSYRLLSELSDGEIIGPILMGMRMPINVLSQESLVQDVINMTAISVLEAEQGVV
ncbi:MAG: NADP-dependent malic enzyme [Candidatus Lambdaproteobacteria bacterium]|nr:NADP-dependent malic enzyme [Candidatus Lambdaproteobacteria bacterium]